MKIDIHAIPEPLLDFGHGRTGVEPRRVLAQPREAGAEIGKLKLALVGPETEVRLTKAWLEGMARFRPARENRTRRGIGTGRAGAKPSAWMSSSRSGLSEP